jgi:hypothetical protein
VRALNKIFPVVLVLLVFVSVVSAQEDCPVIVEQALTAAGEVCAETGRNQACYGNFDLTAELRPEASDVEFTAAGDITDLTNIEGLTLSGMDEEEGTWGVAVLQVQANLPDTLPGQNVTMLLFGDVEIIDASADAEAEDDETVQPMQAFYFRSGIGDAPCAEAPNSGILIQTPEGAGTIELTMNDVNITLGSTAYVQAEPEGEMVFNVIEGEGIVEAEDVERTVPAGSRVTIEIDENMHAEEPPSEVEEYDTGELGALPIDVLPREIEIAGAEATANAGGDIVLERGTWEQVIETMEGCDLDSSMISMMPTITIPVEDIEAVFNAVGGTVEMSGSLLSVSSTEPNIYLIEQEEGGGRVHTIYTVVSSTRIEYVSETITQDCTLTLTGVLQPVGD